jgi:hypothetical protein
VKALIKLERFDEAVQFGRTLAQQHRGNGQVGYPRCIPPVVIVDVFYSAAGRDVTLSSLIPWVQVHQVLQEAERALKVPPPSSPLNHRTCTHSHSMQNVLMLVPIQPRPTPHLILWSQLRRVCVTDQQAKRLL